jgi:hypothetical protein
MVLWVIRHEVEGARIARAPEDRGSQIAIHFFILSRSTSGFRLRLKLSIVERQSVFGVQRVRVSASLMQEEAIFDQSVKEDDSKPL